MSHSALPGLGLPMAPILEKCQYIHAASLLASLQRPGRIDVKNRDLIV